MGTELATVGERAVHGLELAEQMFTAERRQAIASFLNVDASNPVMVPYLAVCASYGLSPVMGEVWLIPQRVKVRDGDSESWQDRFRPAIGRDGYLSIARRDPRFAGLTGSVVCEHDSFEVMYEGGADDPRVLHRWASKPVATRDGVNPAKWRGKVLGAWARAQVRGMPPTFFYAQIHEYYRMRELWEGKGSNRHQVFDEAGQPVMVPDGAWSYLSSMILKCAQSYVLRIAFGITGFVPADELAGMPNARADAEGQVVAEGLDASAFDFTSLTADEALAEDLRAAVGRVNDLAPLSWPPAKVEMVASGMSDDELRGLVARIDGEADVLAARATAARDATAATSAGDRSGSEDPAGGGVTDAEVVSEEKRSSTIDALERRQAQLEDNLNDPMVSEDERRMLLEELDAVEAELAAARESGQGMLL